MSLIVVYLWKESNKLPDGHSAMKIEEEGEARYYSWWPSHQGRATPPTYGKTAATTRREPSAAANADRQRRDMRQREVNNQPGEERIFPVKSDKEMLQSDRPDALPKHATWKFYFRSGLSVEEARAHWEGLLAGEREYSGQSYNCHMPVAESLIKAFGAGKKFERKGAGFQDPVDKKLLKVKKSEQGDLIVPMTTNNKAWNAARMARLCASFAERIEGGDLTNDAQAIVRHNEFKDGTLNKFDYAPKDVAFIAAASTGKIEFSPKAAPGKVNPRLSADHLAGDAQPDAEHFATEAESAGV